MERMVLEAEWQPLFSAQELREAMKRLRDHGFKGPLPEIDAGS